MIPRLVKKTMLSKQQFKHPFQQLIQALLFAAFFAANLCVIKTKNQKL